MQFSKKWLQQYIREALPGDKEIENVVTFNAFEVEEIIVKNDDILFDIKVLPNRAHDALSHRAMAHEIASLLNLTFVDPYEYYSDTGDTTVAPPLVHIEDEKACQLFMSVRVDGVKVEASPAWLKEPLEAIGQRSINNIVDITNFVQFAINKPMHAYDASLISGDTLCARFARTGETLLTLDDKTLELDTQTLVIADTEKPLGLAGIKGGKYSGISKETTSIILESANFNPALIRKTAQKYGMRSDASKRFENGIADSLVEEGLRMTIALIKKIYPDAKVSMMSKAGTKSSWQYVASVSHREVNSVLGTAYSLSDIEEVFDRLSFSYSKATAREMIEKRIKEATTAVYKNPSSMRADVPNAFSCSSLMSFLYNGIWQPSISIDKYVYGEKIEEKDLVWGDLIFSNTGEGRIYFESVSFLPGTKVEGGIDHVGMYVGEGKVLHISKAHNAVKEELLSEAQHFAGTRHFVRMCDVDEERFFITAPEVRLDIRIKEDLLEEIARTKGLSTIKGILPHLNNKKGLPHKRLYYETKIKNILFANGFSEMYTYTFGNKGEVSIMKALMDKKKLRTNLAEGVKEAFQMNYVNAPLLGVKEIRVFEFGNVFTKTSERRHFSFAIDDGAKKSTFKENSDLLLAEIKGALGLSDISYDVVSQKPHIVEIDFDALIKELPEPTETVFLDTEIKEKGMSAVLSPISPYPFIVRDIAVWVPEEITFESIKGEVEKALGGDIKMLARPIALFDSFTKEGRTSFAFRLVIQSHSKTLTDSEANIIADTLYGYLKGKGYEVR